MGFMGLGNYAKPGPGVDVEDNRPALFIFLDIYFRKFWNLIKINFLLFFFSIPSIILYMLAATIALPAFFQNEISFDFFFKMFIGEIFFCIPVIACGPAQAGFTYVLRNYAREEHAFIFSDFKEHAMKNFKQSMIVSAIDFVIFIVGLTALWFYFNYSKTNALLIVPATLLIVALVIFAIMHMYMYTMMVTFDLRIKDIYKNAFIFTILKFFSNLFILAICVVLIMVPFLLGMLGFFLLPVIIPSTIGLITNFHVFPILKKYIIDPTEESGNEGEEEIETEEQKLLEEEKTDSLV